MKMGLGALLASALPIHAIASVLEGNSAERSLHLFNTHTNEQLRVCYFKQGGYCRDGLARINHILRDHRTGKVAAIDPHLLDLLHTVKGQVQPTEPFHIISGYRSPQTNAQLRKNGTGVARKSFHTTGEAIDVRLPGYSTKRLRQLCLQMKAGGVGYYPRSDFVHLDIGPVRSW
ncbi:MAG: DUF882 domain-containing protein [Desulfatitalea sp.]|nr:DUF882 domain-containing protein [Desulfatitalea sp.]